MRDQRFGRLSITRPVAAGLMLAATGAIALSPGAARAAVTRPGPPRTIYAAPYAAHRALYRLNPRSHAETLEGHAGIFLTDITFRRKVVNIHVPRGLYWPCG